MSVLRSFLLSLLCAAAALAAVEGATRFFALAPARTRFLAEFTTGREFVRRDAEAGFVLVPGFSDGSYEVNDAGFRGAPLPEDLGNRRTILCSGDSTTFGWQVGPREPFPARLGRRLEKRSHGRFWVVNGGVPSFTSAQVAKKLLGDLERLKPEIVVVTMPWNDMWYSSFAPWTPGVLIPRLPGPLRMGLMRRSAFFRILAQPPVPEPEPNRSAEEALLVFEANLLQIIQTIRQADATPVLQTPPFDLDHVAPGGLRFKPTGLHWDRQFVLETARRYVERFEAMARDADALLVSNPLSVQNPRQKELFIDEIHPTGAGYDRTVENLLTALDAKGLLSN